MMQPNNRAEDWSRIRGAATQAGLGAARAKYDYLATGWLKVVMAVSFGAVVVAWLSPLPKLLASIGTAIALLAVLGFLRFVGKRDRGARLDLFEHGLTLWRRGVLRVVRYDDTQVLQHIVRHTYGGSHTGTDYEYTLTDVTGAKLRLTHHDISKPERWGSAIQEAVTRAQLPSAWEKLTAGHQLGFGPIWVTAEQVGAGNKAWPWAHIQEVRVQKGVVKLRAKNRWISLTSTQVSSIPNVFVFITLAEQLQAAHQQN